MLRTWSTGVLPRPRIHRTLKNAGPLCQPTLGPERVINRSWTQHTLLDGSSDSPPPFTKVRSDTHPLRDPFETRIGSGPCYFELINRDGKDPSRSLLWVIKLNALSCDPFSSAFPIPFPAPVISAYGRRLVRYPPVCTNRTQEAGLRWGSKRLPRW